MNVLGLVLSWHYVGLDRRQATVEDFERFLENYGHEANTRKRSKRVSEMSVKELPVWFVRVLLQVFLGVVSVSMPIAAYQSFAWIRLVSEHVRSSESGYARLANLERRTDKLDDILRQLRADQLSKYIWEALRSKPPDLAKAAEWERQLKELVMEQRAKASGGGGGP